MLPVIALVGRPNVGKSTLFNQLTRSRDALVADLPGLTRDRKYGEGKVGDKPFIVVDTGGISNDEGGVENLMVEQVQLAIAEADQVCFLVDARAGLLPDDEEIARHLRSLSKNVQLVVNKTDGLAEDEALLDFYALGFEDIHSIAASHGRGVNKLVENLFSHIQPIEEEAIEAEQEDQIKIAFIGRPNVGKSTLVNRILGEERVVVYDAPGTTRDSIFIPFERQGQHYTLIDTAGVRRRGKVSETIEKFSVIKSLQAIEKANVVVFVIDAQEGITEQDLRLLGFVLDAGRALVIAVNKWDGLESYHKERVKEELHRRLVFLDYARKHHISALHGTGVGDLYKSIHEAYKAAFTPLTTNKLTQLLEMAIEDHQPPLARGRRIKLRYAHPGGHNPPIIVIHGNQTEIPGSYQRYLANFFRERLKLMGTPIRLQFKTGANPFAGQRKKLTPRQEVKKKRLMKFVKRKKK